MHAITVIVFCICVVTYPVVAQLSPNVSYSSPDVFPSPNATGAGGWEAALARAQDFLNELTTEEKIYLVTGVHGPCVGTIAPIPRLGFNGLCLQDGPLAIRVADFASVFSAGLSAAASWDRSLTYQRGALMAQEFKDKGAHILLGPVVGPLGRHALGGRNWEGFSPDPYLTGVLVNESIVAIQNTGVQACVKHYIGNEQETQRNPATVRNVRVEAVSSNIDDRTIHELYGWPFANAIKAGTSSVMCSYNRINSSYGCQNSKLLNGMLKDELGFQGYVVSDWGAVHSGVLAIDSGLDMDMPGGNDGFFGDTLTGAINNGSLLETRLDDMVIRIMTPYFHLGQDKNFPTIDPSSGDLGGFDASQSGYDWILNGTKNRDVRGDHAELIRELGAASVTLLKNTNNVLPISTPPRSIGVFGNDAADLTDGLYSGVSAFRGRVNGWNIGTQYVGDGSGTGRLTYLVSPLEAIKAWALPARSLVQYVTNNTAVAGYLPSVYPKPDVCFVFLKTYATEGRDRTSLASNFGGDDVVTSVARYCNNTIVITHSAGPNTMPWADHPNVTAILAAHLPGQESGNSIMDVISGTVNPSGKLPFTIANNESDYNAPITNLTGTTEPNAWQSDFTEGLMIDYRHFDSANITPRYEFGFGLSYTTFSISGLSAIATATNISALPPASASLPGGNPLLWDTVATATFTVSNTGTVSGATVPQLYVGFPSDTSPPETPPQVLRGFDKILLQPGESQSVTFSLARRDLSYWNVVAQQWQIPAGTFTLKVGMSSRDIQATGSVSLV